MLCFAYSCYRNYTRERNYEYENLLKSAPQNTLSSETGVPGIFPPALAESGTIRLYLCRVFRRWKTCFPFA